MLVNTLFRGKKIVFKVNIQNENLVISITNLGDVILKEYKKEVFNRFKKVIKRVRQESLLKD